MTELLAGLIGLVVGAGGVIVCLAAYARQQDAKARHGASAAPKS